MGSVPQILITGGCGYIGSQIAVEMLSSGSFQPISIDSFINSDSAIPDRIRRITGREYINYPVDLLDIKAVTKVFEAHEISGVIHLAALKSIPESLDFPLRYYQNNLISLVNVLSCCEAFSVEKLVFSSSCSVYGDGARSPVSEDSPLPEKQLSAYSATKKMGEEIVADFARQSGIHAMILRYFNPAGCDLSGEIGEAPSDEGGFIPKLVWKALKGERIEIFGNDYETIDGTCIRDFIHIKDLARAHILALTPSSPSTANPEIVNLGTGTGISLMQVVHTLKELIGEVDFAIGERRPGDIPAIYSENAKAKSLLDWVPQYGLREMLASQIHWTRTWSALKGQKLSKNK